MLGRVIREGLPREVTLELRPKQFEGVSSVTIWEKNVFSGRSNSECKGSKAGVSMSEERKSSHWPKGAKRKG